LDPVGLEWGSGSHHISATIPDDPLFEQQWHHFAIGSDIAWDHGRADGVVIAIIDTGVDCTHPDLAGVCVEGFDFYNDDSDPTDDHQHGTIEAGVAAAVTNNGKGVSGLAWGAKIMPLKVMSASGQGSISAVVGAIVYAADSGADIISLSLGTPEDRPALRQAIAYAADSGVLIAAAGGNGGPGPIYPAAYPGAIGVAGVNQSDGHPGFTTGSHLEVAAPGWEILSTTLVSKGSYGRFSGTSEATPLVAGLSALLMAQNPDWDAEAVRSRMITTAIDLGDPGWDQYFGWGRIDAGRAMDPAVLPDPDAPNPGGAGKALFLPWLSGSR
jgi:subtilisin family serine protease